MLPTRSILEILPQRIKLYNEFKGLCSKSKIFSQICVRNNCAVMNSTISNSNYLISLSKTFRSSGLSSTYFPLSLRRNLGSSKKEDDLRNRDQVASEFSVIYKAPMDKYVIYGQRINSAGILGTIALGVNELYYLGLPHIDFSSGHLQSYTEFIMLYFGLVFTVVALQSLLFKYPLRIYHNSSNDAYIAIFVNFLGLPSKMNFSKGQVEKVKPSGHLPWKDNKFSIKSKKVILFENYFRLPSDYNSLLNIKRYKDS